MNTTRDQNYYRALRDRLGILSSEDLSGLIGVAEKTLQRWRRNKVGPAFFYVNRTAFYRMNDISFWLDNRATSYPVDLAPELELEQAIEHEHDEADTCGAGDPFYKSEAGDAHVAA